MTSRREFLIRSSLAIAAASFSRMTPANPLNKPIGIQLYTVNDAMETDPAGTLKKLREIGYSEVETAGFGKLSAKQFRKLIDDAGLVCPSAHLAFDPENLNRAFDDAHALGATYVVSSMLPNDVAGPNAKGPMTLEQTQRTIERANRIGEGARKAGLQYAYHNHAIEFVDVGNGVLAYDLLLEKTDPSLVKFEIDCGWMVFAGKNPVDYFKKHSQRIALIHVKDFEKRGAGETEMRGAELGTGVVDYAPIFTAAGPAGLQHYFVEQEGPFSRMSRMDAARVDHAYLRALKVKPHRVT
jgi:sugar phosphate isomerase/epimerase